LRVTDVLGDCRGQLNILFRVWIVIHIHNSSHRHYTTFGPAQLMSPIPSIGADDYLIRLTIEHVNLEELKTNAIVATAISLYSVILSRLVTGDRKLHRLDTVTWSQRVVTGIKMVMRV